jgi:hypothetical protein
LISARVENWGEGHWYSEVSPTPAPTRRVWVVNIGYDDPSPTGGEGWYVVLDYGTGEILSLSHWNS